MAIVAATIVPQTVVIQQELFASINPSLLRLLYRIRTRSQISTDVSLSPVFSPPPSGVKHKPKARAPETRTSVSRIRRRRERGAPRHSNCPGREVGNPLLTEKSTITNRVSIRPWLDPLPMCLGIALPQLTTQIPGVNL